MAVVVEVELLRCTRCKVLFAVCTADFRGQGYCSPLCRVTSSLELRRAANARHQAGEEGRLDHRDRMRAWRVRNAVAVVVVGGSVTDAGSRELDSSMKCSPCGPVIVRRSLYASPVMAFVVDNAAPSELLRCRVCGVLGTHVVRRRSRAPP